VGSKFKGTRATVCSKGLGLPERLKTNNYSELLCGHNVGYDTVDVSPRDSRGGARAAWDLKRRTEIIPVKDSHTRIKSLPLASVTPERTLVSVGEWPSHIAVINL
jgi:hypothetical protein